MAALLHGTRRPTLPLAGGQRPHAPTSGVLGGFGVLRVFGFFFGFVGFWVFFGVFGGS